MPRARKSRSRTPTFRPCTRCPPGAIVSLEDGAKVSVGDVIARIPQESSKTRDITGGLPRVADLFEARKPKDSAILAEYSGTVSFGKETKGKRRLIITDEQGEKHEELIPKWRHLNVFEGEQVERGEVIADGEPNPHDILRLQGVESLANYLVREIQDVYRLQGVKINDKHIEVIIRQMLRKVEIAHTGDTALLRGEQLDRARVTDVNERIDGAGQDRRAHRAGAAGHHQGVAGDRVVHFGGFVPGDDPRADRSGGARPEGRPARLEGERDRRPADPGGNGLVLPLAAPAPATSAPVAASWTSAAAVADGEESVSDEAGAVGGVADIGRWLGARTFQARLTLLGPRSYNRAPLIGRRPSMHAAPSNQPHSLQAAAGQSRGGLVFYVLPYWNQRL